MNLPNKLTIFRIILVPIMAIIPFFNFDNSPSAEFQLLKSPTTDAVVASFASTENVTLQTGFVLINCLKKDMEK